MSYNKTIWTAGDTITAEKLNNIENGIVANEPLIVTFAKDDQDVYHADKTADEILTAGAAGTLIVGIVSDWVAGYLSHTPVISLYVSSYNDHGTERFVLSGGSTIPASSKQLIGYCIHVELDTMNCMIDRLVCNIS